MDKKQKNGISLIVLVITIIVMIILAAAIIISINNNGIIENANKAATDTDINQVKSIANAAWGTSYAKGARTLAALKEGVDNELEASVEETKLANYEISVGLKGVTVTNITKLPDDWESSVEKIIDKVPIPKGFVASNATGENQRDKGLVIYEGSTEVNDENVAEAKTTRNQYVWVPVYNFMEFGNKEYVYTNSSGVKRNFSLSKVMGEGEWEVLKDENNIPIDTQPTEYVSPSTIIEAKKMYESVRKYGGFFIARYEAGLNIARNSSDVLKKGVDVNSMQNKYPYTYIGWSSSDIMNVDTGGVVEVARSVLPNNSENTTGVVSTLLYGSQYYRLIEWIEETGTFKDLWVYDNKSRNFGNTASVEIKLDEFTKGAKYVSMTDMSYTPQFKDIKTGKLSSSSLEDLNNQWLLTTGALEKFKINNIYDLIGNVGEKYMSGRKSSQDGKLYRLEYGGTCRNDVQIRSVFLDNINLRSGIIGFRTALYIK